MFTIIQAALSPSASSFVRQCNTSEPFLTAGDRNSFANLFFRFVFKTILRFEGNSRLRHERRSCSNSGTDFSAIPLHTSLAPVFFSCGVRFFSDGPNPIAWHNNGQTDAVRRPARCRAEETGSGETGRGHSERPASVRCENIIKAGIRMVKKKKKER